MPDVPGIILATSSALGLAWGLVRGNSAGWNSLEVVAALGTGLVLAAGFVVCELRTGEPMMPIRFFPGAFASGIASSFFFYASMYGVLFFLPQFLQATQGLCPFGAGVRLMPWTATLFVAARKPVAGNLIKRVGERPLVVCRPYPAGARYGMDRTNRNAGARVRITRPAADPGRYGRVNGYARGPERHPERGSG